MYAALSRSVCALPLNLIWDFETTSNLTTEGFSRKEIMQRDFLICAVDFFSIYTQNSIPMKPVNA